MIDETGLISNLSCVIAWFKLAGTSLNKLKDVYKRQVINYRLCNGENANVQDAMEKAVEASVAGAQKFHKSQVESETDDEGDDL